ncbi:MAG: prepilin peptidase [Gammaproteobacteria bacterium]|nr:prepilin peptidase [Gammaproteobacteria bacterium]
MSLYFKQPGLSHGVYPERHTSDKKKRVKFSLRKAEKFITAVNDHEKNNNSSNDKQLQEQLVTLKIQLRSQGLDPDLVAKSFALIREFSFRRLAMRHHDEQLLAGWILINGMLAEMQTGEGKTLTATLAAGTTGLAGIPTHIMTSNDYLVTRDAAKMGPLYKSLGLSIGIITENTATTERRHAYAKNITYGTATQIAFDYMQDHMLIGSIHPLHLQADTFYNISPMKKKLRLRGLCYAIVDEADSIFIDEARTPLIISNTMNNEDQDRFYETVLKLAIQLEKYQDFNIDIKSKTASLTTDGEHKLEQLFEKKQTILTNIRQRNELVQQALNALYLLIKNKHYLVKDNKIQIINENTGRLMDKRSWPQGLQQLLESKEALPLTKNKETLARMSFQSFFNRYLLLSGMTGTAREISSELKEIYALNVITVPAHKSIKRKYAGHLIYSNNNAKYAAILDTVRLLYKKRKPVLLGTRSVEESEKVALLLTESGIVNQILNAKQDRQEAEKIAQAGQPGQVTVATNMAGRGTDIILSNEARKLGGLHIIIIEQNDSARIDRQLTGRCARQGDPGHYQFIVSLDDRLFTQVYSPFSLKYIVKLTNKKSKIPSWIGVYLVSRAQRKIEKNHQTLRKKLLKTDLKRKKMLAFSGK